MMKKLLVVFAVILLLTGCTLHVAEPTTSLKNTQNTTTRAPTTTTMSMTMGQKNALASAKSYLSFTAFSYTGLIKQLEFEKYSHEDATFAADHCGADWYEQAAKSAEAYLEFTSFSRDGLIDQLEFEGFTHSQAVYGVEQNGY